MPEFVKGLTLNESFYFEAVAPLLREGFPRLVYSVGRIGRGSDALGLDTAMSTDHDWGPRLELFLADVDCAEYAAEVSDFLARRLPPEFRGFSVGFTAPDQGDNGTQCMDYDAGNGPVKHRVSIQTVQSFLVRHLGLDPRRSLDSLDWLSMSEQSLLEVTSGAVFRDGLGELGPVRSLLAYYPREIWLYRLAAQWHRLGQEEPFVGRCGTVDDDLGSRVVTARLTRDLMRLCFLMERRYAPYSKWIGTAFKQLRCQSRILPVLLRALRADTWEERERSLGEASSLAGLLHNALEITPPISVETRQFFNRPFRVIAADRFSEALLAQIGDAWLRSLPVAGGVDQYCDCTDIVSNPRLAQRLRALYDTDE